MKPLFEPGDFVLCDCQKINCEWNIRAAAQANARLASLGISVETPGRIKLLEQRLAESEAYIASWKRDEANWIEQERDLKQRLQAQTEAKNTYHLQLRALEKQLAEAPLAYGDKTTGGHWYFCEEHRGPYPSDTHKARLVMIEPIGDDK